jgi:CubicO group peptidase (beta-lactamase class C family)
MFHVTHPCLQQALATIDRYVGDLMARDGAPDVALAVTDRNGVFLTHEHGYVDPGARLPIEPAPPSRQQGPWSVSEFSPDGRQQKPV